MPGYQVDLIAQMMSLDRSTLTRHFQRYGYLGRVFVVGLQSIKAGVRGHPKHRYRIRLLQWSDIARIIQQRLRAGRKVKWMGLPLKY